MPDTTPTPPAPTSREALAAFLAAFPPEHWTSTAQDLTLARTVPLSVVFASVPVDRSGHSAAAMRLFHAAPALAAAAVAAVEADDALADALDAFNQAFPHQPSAAEIKAMGEASAMIARARSMAREAALQAGAL